ncbi:MAG TPA: peptidase S41, partial [Anaeromyxobacteraceae bacterium]
GEADLDRHLQNPAQAAVSPQDASRRGAERPAERPPLELRYLLDEKEDAVAKALKADERREAAARAHAEAEVSPEQQEDEDVDANPDEVVEDYQIRFARELLARHPYADRPRLLEAAKLLVAERRAEEAARLEQRLGALGVDWSAAAAAGAPRAVVAVSPPPGKKAHAGETLPWTVTVENRGDGPYRRLRAWSVVQKNPLLDRREFVFGLVRPGEKRSWTVPVKIPPGMDSRHDVVRIHFEDDGGNAPPDVLADLDVVEAPRPAFALSAQVDDLHGGNGDGMVQRGEEITLRVDVRNEGHGPSGERTYVTLKNLGDEKISIKRGRVVLGSVKPGESRTALLPFEVKKGLKADAVPLRIAVVDERLEEIAQERLDLPVRPDGSAAAAGGGAVRVAADRVVVRAGAGAEAPPLALARKGAVLPVQARFGDALRVEWAKGRFGFVTAGEVRTTQARPAGTATPLWQREPPRIALLPDPAKGAPVVDVEKLHVEGHALVSPSAPGARTRLRDVFVYANDQKVFFKLAPDGAASRIDFAADVPLKPGNNVVTVFAREDEDYQTHRSFVVHRRTPEVAQGAR